MALEFECDLYEDAKRLRLEELTGRIEHLRRDFVYWRLEYASHGDQFARKMYYVTYTLLQDVSKLKTYIERPDVVCMPKMTYSFPEADLRQ